MKVTDLRGNAPAGQLSAPWERKTQKKQTTVFSFCTMLVIVTVFFGTEFFIFQNIRKMEEERTLKKENFTELADGAFRRRDAQFFRNEEYVKQHRIKGVVAPVIISRNREKEGGDLIE